VAYTLRLLRRLKRTNATSIGIRSSSQCRRDPASDLRIFPTTIRRIPSDSPPSIFRSRHAPPPCDCRDHDARRSRPRPREFRSRTPRLLFRTARELDTEVTQNRRTRPFWVTVEKNVVAISPQAWLAANERPDVMESWSPRQAHCTTPSFDYKREKAYAASITVTKIIVTRKTNTSDASSMLLERVSEASVLPVSG
jgi:hypothetical protein